MKIVSMVFCCVLLWIQSSGQSCTISSTSTNISCYGSNDGTAEVVVSGGGSGGASNCSSPQAPGVNDNCTTGCNTTVTTNTNVTVTLGQKVCITTNNYTGTIQLDGGTAVLCGTGSAPKVIFNGGSLVLTGSADLSDITYWASGPSNLINYGTMTMTDVEFDAGFYNHGTAIISDGFVMGSNASSFVNTGLLTVSSGNFTIISNGTSVNHNTITVSAGSMTLDWSKSFTNNCTLNISNTFTSRGSFTNAGSLTAATLVSEGGTFTHQGTINISGTSSFTGGNVTTSPGSQINTANMLLSISITGTGSSCSSIRVSGNTNFNWGAAISGEARYCDLDGVLENNLPNLTANIDLTTCSCLVGAPVCTYSWKNSSSLEISTNAEVSSLSAGTYTVTVTCTGCSNSPLIDTITILAPSLPLTATVSTTSIECYGSATGKATVSPSGGYAPYRFEWRDTMNLLTDTTATPSTLKAGYYTLTIRDSADCQIVLDSILIAQPAALYVVSLSATSVRCVGDNNGSIQSTITGGKAPFTYFWQPHGETTPHLTGLSAGVYSLTVTDSAGCSLGPIAAEVKEPEFPLSAVPSVNDAQCNYGNIVLSVSGGTGPYAYHWNTGDTTQNLMGAEAATYSVLVTDSEGCTVTTNAEVPASESLELSLTHTDVTYYGGDNGTATVTIGNPGAGGSMAADNCSNVSPVLCTTGCTVTYTADTGAVQLNNVLDKICLTSSNFTGTIELNAAGTLVICGTASPSSIQINNGAKVYITGTGSLKAPSISVNNLSILENYGTLHVTGGLFNNNQIINRGILTVTGSYSDNGTGFMHNWCTMGVGSNLTANGILANKGTLTVEGLTTINTTATLELGTGSALLTEDFEIHGDISGPDSGVCASLKIEGHTTIGNNVGITGVVSVCDSNGIEVNYSTGLSAYLNCDCELGNSSCSIVWSNDSTGTTVTGLTAGTHSVVVSCGKCTVTKTFTVDQTATILINTVHVNPGSYTIEAPGISLVQTQSGLALSEDTISPSLPIPGQEGTILLQVAAGSDNRALDIRLGYNSMNELTFVEAKMEDVYKAIHPDYYEIKDRNKIYFYNEKPEPPAFPVSTNLKNGVLLDPVSRSFELSVPVNSFFTGVSLSIHQISVSPTVSVYGPSAVLSWDGSSAAPGVYRFVVEFSFVGGAKSYQGQFIVE